MYGTQVIMVMLLLRLVIPIALLLWIGETTRRRHLADFHGTPNQA